MISWSQWASGILSSGLGYGGRCCGWLAWVSLIRQSPQSQGNGGSRAVLLQADDHIARRREDYFADDATAMAAAKQIIGDLSRRGNLVRTTQSRHPLAWGSGATTATAKPIGQPCWSTAISACYSKPRRRKAALRRCARCRRHGGIAIGRR